MKVLYLPLGDQQSVVKAFQNTGVELRVFDFLGIFQNYLNQGMSNGSSDQRMSNQFVDVVREFKPDLIHMQLQMTGLMTSEALIEAKNIVPNVVITNWTGDIRQHTSESFIKTSKYVDFSLMSNTGQIELYKNAGCKNPTYWQIGFDDKNHFPKFINSFKYDVSFIANNYNDFPDSNLRSSAANKIKNEFGDRAGIFGSGFPGGPVSFGCINDIYNDSLCVLSISNFNDVSHYFSDRLPVCLATGRPVICYRFPGLDSYLQDGRDVVVVNSIDEIIDNVKYFKENVDKANIIGKNGYMKAISEHSFTSRILELYSIAGVCI